MKLIYALFFSPTETCNSALGMMSGTILPTSIKYSSKETNSGDGRLQQKPWVPMKGQEIGSYIEVSFNDQIGTFSKVHFQGGSLGGNDSGYVTSFKIEVRSENGNWNPVKGVSYQGS